MKPRLLWRNVVYIWVYMRIIYVIRIDSKPKLFTYYLSLIVYEIGPGIVIYLWMLSILTKFPTKCVIDHLFSCIKKLQKYTTKLSLSCKKWIYSLCSELTLHLKEGIYLGMIGIASQQIIFCVVFVLT